MQYEVDFRSPEPRVAPPPRRRPWLPLLPLAVAVAASGALLTWQLGGAVTTAASAEPGDAFVADLAFFAQGFEDFRRDTGTLPPAAGPGEVPAGMSIYLPADRWGRPSPVGGSWRSVRDREGVIVGIGVEFNQPPDEHHLALLDDRIDDGRLGSGRLRLTAGGRLLLYTVQ